MILEEANRIYTCEHKKRIKKKQSYNYKGYPVYLCKECESLKKEVENEK